MVLFSVVMPSYNHEQFIAEAIESVLNQTIRDLELIIIDDYSIDSSREIINEYKKLDNRIKVIFHEKNRGISKTINDGIENARGKFVAIIASDDVWHPNKLEKQNAILNQNESLIVWTEGEIINDDSKYIGKKFTNLFSLNHKKSGNLFYELLHRNSCILLGSSLIFKRSNLGNIKFHEDLKYDNDFLFYVELASKFDFYFINTPLTKYRIHKRSTAVRISHQKKEKYKDRIKLNLFLMKIFKNEIPKELKWKIFLRLIIALFELDKKKARAVIFHGIRLFPLKYLNYLFLIKSYINSAYFSKIFAKIQNILK